VRALYLSARLGRRTTYVLGGLLWSVALGCGGDRDGQTPRADETASEARAQTGAPVPCAPSIDAGAPKAADAGAPADDGALWCAVRPIWLYNCGACHDEEGTLGAPMSLLTYEDFFKPAPISQGKKNYEAVVARMHDPKRPMPPIGMLDPPDLKKVDDWVAAGLPPPPKAGCPEPAAEPEDP
jgi:hypothetical protein